LRACAVHATHESSQKSGVVSLHLYRINELAVCAMSSLFLIALELIS
jgi:hypothetical protein